MNYKTQGVCAQNIEFEVEDGVLTKVSFAGGCNGNLKGISSLAIGMKVTDLIEKLEGTDCKGRGTSCPDQFSKALKQYVEENEL